MVEIILGIDLGTTNSCMAYVDDFGRPQVINEVNGGRTTPSVVGFDEFKQCIIGADAKSQSIIHPESTFRSVKSYMGKTRDELKNINEYPKYKNKKGEIYLPQEISALVLGKLKADAENYLGKQIRKAVITVPAYFNDAQKNATKDAGKIAGLDVIRVINEPTAAAIAYGLNHAGNDQTILVYDLGGGTFDVSVMTITTDTDDDEAEMIFDVVSTIGDTHLGGDNFDDEIVKYIISEIKSTNGIDVSTDPQSCQIIKQEAENIKKRLSNVTTARIGINNIGPNHSINYSGVITKDQFESMINGYISKTTQLSKEAEQMAQKKLRSFSLDKVLLVGGSTKIPFVKQMVERQTGKPPAQDINPDECVAIGAAIQGRIIALENGWADEIDDPLLVEIEDETYGVSNKAPINHNSNITNKPPKKTTLTVYDVTSQDLGIVAVIDNVENTFSRIIEKNTQIPVRKSETYFTIFDNQTSLQLSVIQGQDSNRYPKADDTEHNKIIWGAEMPISPAKVGEYAYVVNFNLDDNGMLFVTADEYHTKLNPNNGGLCADLNRKTSKKINFNVKLSSDLTREEIRDSQDELRTHMNQYKSNF